MNILFFLTPKNEVEFVYNDDTLQQALDILEKSTYTAIPIINHKGEYKGTISEGDLLWTLRDEANLNMQALCDMKVSRVNRKYNNKPVKANAMIDDLMHVAINQNFVPVIDDDDVFIGIVKRRDVIRYYFESECAKRTNGNNEERIVERVIFV